MNVRAFATAASLVAFAACSTAPQAASPDIAHPDPAKDVTSPSPSPSDIKWEEECLLYPRQDALKGLQGSGIRRHCTESEEPESVSSAVKEGLAGDEKTATALARVVLAHVYGDRVLDSAQPTATAKGDRWVVQWEVRAPETKPDALKRLTVEIAKRTGAVSRIFVSVVKE